eukprot:jgi/Tetstr1/466888/TSEL_011343.t1
MIDFTYVSSSSTTPTWGNDPRWCTPGIAATEAEHNKPAADRAPPAPAVQEQGCKAPLRPNIRKGHDAFLVAQKHIEENM